MAKILTFLFLIAVSFLNAVAVRNRIHVGRIIGGTNAPEGSYPYQVSLRVEDSHNCGGSIISKDYVLTAAHCIIGLNLKNMKAVVGITKLSDGGSKHAILEAHTHENWNDKKIKNDIAVLKVEEITFSSKVAPITLDTSEILDDLPCTASGWGLITYPKPTIFPNHLQHINLTTISFEKCKRMNDDVLLVDMKKEICTLTKVGKGICISDSGGPLVRNVDGVKKQIGIVSWGDGCADGHPDVYARVSFYIDWIKEICDDCV